MDQHVKKASASSFSLGAYIHKLLSVPKTVYFNFKALDFKTACRLPVLVSYRVKITELKKGCISFDGTPSRFMVKIGFGAARELTSRPGNVCISGHVHFGGPMDLGEGIILACSGRMSIGAHLYANANCTFWCSREIVIGEDNRLGWNVLIRDSDGHPLMDSSGRAKPYTQPVHVGRHCWLCSDSSLLKGSSLPEGSVLAYRAVLTKPFSQANALYAGIPAALARQDIHWPRGEEEAKVNSLLY